MTVSGLVDVYLADPAKSNRRTHDEIERRLRKNVVPMIGEVRLDKLRRRDVRTCVDPILRRESPVEASRVFEDVRALAHPVLRHRIITNFHAQSEGITTDILVDRLLEAVPLPRS